MLQEKALQIACISLVLALLGLGGFCTWQYVDGLNLEKEIETKKGEIKELSGKLELQNHAVEELGAQKEKAFKRADEAQAIAAKNSVKLDLAINNMNKQKSIVTCQDAMPLVNQAIEATR